MPIAAGQLAPDFTLPTDTGDTLTLSSLRGQWVVLYGYPKDDTSGCTTQACEFRDLFPRFDQKKAVILGISPDSVKSHVKFKTKYELPFTLVADEEKVALQAYDIWKEKSMYGKKYMGVERTTFVIDPKGQIVKVFEKVKPAGHAEEVMAVIR
ncbi:thioredoxin-dependent thiol peroxidase [Gemmatimonas sp.]|jgi:peroxiredoxin Q/BCP|uniref:thioredoxin-dependent thiol peroxidase n=1 Tax=Gemmatimonas sp. TaxID=1962908 RepID=UPI0031C6A121|nr:thioredoxin-dependent thiol peroxidase [Gemmatimonas sp.]